MAALAGGPVGMIGGSRISVVMNRSCARVVAPS